MKKKIFVIAVLFTVTTLLLINFYLELSSDSSLIDALGQPRALSREEREWILDHGQIIYGSDNNSPPLRYADHESGQYRGIVVDYLRALSIEIGVEIVYKPMVWSEALEALERGETDLSDMYPSEERAKKYLFSEPIYNQKGVILVPQSEKGIINHHDLAGKTVALQKGDYVHEFLQGEVTGIEYTFTPDYQSAIMLLKDSDVDAVVGDEPVLSYFIEVMDLKDQFYILDNALYEKESIFAVPKSHKNLLNILNYGIGILNKKNTMEKIHRKWFGISAPFIKENTSKKILLITLFFLYMILLGSYIFYSWNNQLKKEVDKRTRELNIIRNDLETTFDGLIHLMIVLDENRRIVNVNSSFCKIMKMEKKAMLGRDVSDFPEFLQSDKIRDLIRETFELEKSEMAEFKYGGKIFEVSTFPLQYEPRQAVERIIIMMKDVTRIRISDQKILQSNKMSAIGHLAAGVAHEIRNPLGLIRNYAYVLKKDRGKNQDKFKKSIDIIELSVEKASSIIENLLDFSRISGDKSEPINLSGLISSIFMLEYKVIARNNIREVIECDDEIICYLNRESLKLVLINCISNAVDAMPKGGILTIKAKKEKDSLIISCADTGTGIRGDDVEKVFNPFFSTKPSGEGTGLGLYVAYNEVQKIGGEIQVSSEYGIGTDFTITIPVGEPE